MRYLMCTIIVLLAWHICLAQDNNTYFHHLSVENGLSEASNAHVYKDSRGFVWISSVSGLNRFDSRQVKIYQPDANDPTSVFGQNIQSSFFEDPNGDLWFSTYEGINKYIRKTDRFEHFTALDTNNQKPYTAYVVVHKDSENQLWVLINEQFVYTFDTKTHQFKKKNTVTPNSQCFQVQTNKQNKVIRSFANTWSGGNCGMLMTQYFDNGTIKQDTLFDKKSTTPLSILDLFFEYDNVWISCFQGLFHYHFDKKILTNFYVGDKVNSVSLLNEKQLLLSTQKNGALIMNKSSGKVVREFKHSDYNRNSIAKDFTTAACLDNNQNIWIQMTGQGLDFTNLSKTKFNTIYQYPNVKNLDEPFNAVGLIVDNNGDLWTGSANQNLRRFSKDGELKDNFALKAAGSNALMTNSTVIPFMDKQKRTWFLNYNALHYFETSSQSFKKINAPNLIFLYGVVSKSGKILVASFTGIYEVFETPKKGFEFKLIPQIPTNKPHTILFEDNDGLIWGSYDAISINVYNPSKNYELLKSLPLNGVMTGFWHQSNTAIVWVSSQNGLYKIDKKTWQVVSFKEESGLPSRTINVMQADAANNLWLGTSKGLAKFDPSILKAQAYNMADGISDLNFNLYASAQALDGTMYFGSGNGITSFHPSKVTPLSIKAQPTITNILINDQPATGIECKITAATNISEINHLSLNYAQNTLSFTFAAMEYSDPRHCQFQYKMEGVDEDWVRAGTQNFARYAALPAGAYRFLVKASNSDGVWNDTPKMIEIVIIPPFYKTWWFILLCSLAALALIGYIVYLRLSKVIELQGVRLKLYENLHDDIGSRLTAIVLSVEQLIYKSKQNDSGLHQISDISKSIVGNMRRLVWATAPENDALKNITDKMREDRRYLLPEHIAFEIVMDKSLQTLAITGDKRYQMLSVFNEALTNIAKYAGATAVKISLVVVEENLEMTIEDNGKGFDPQKNKEDKPNSSGYGLGNMQKRANRVKGTFQIKSTEGLGTIIKFGFPLKESILFFHLKDYFSKYH
jgi:ligand-binding sensor domain-containing protein/anti-sigma regulatory factor (Ser/Thr protein kinase)